MKLFLVIFTLLTFAPSYACSVSEADMFGTYSVQAGDHELIFIDLFFEHGAHILNATTSEHTNLVGSWELFNCHLQITYQIEDVNNVVVFEIISIKGGQLKVRDVRFEHSIIFFKDST